MFDPETVALRMVYVFAGLAFFVSWLLDPGIASNPGSCSIAATDRTGNRE